MSAPYADGPPARNQRKTEPMPPTEGHDVPASVDGGGDRPDEGAGTATSPGPREGWAQAPPSSGPAGDAAGVPVVSESPAEGTSERMAPVEGVAFAAPARADGEPDIEMPSTTSF